jgi:hypothetical protein
VKNQVSKRELLMQQWEDDTLVAISSERGGRYRVLELPARSGRVHPSRRTFPAYEQAEDYINDQYPSALVVPIEDIQEEKKRRAVSARPGVSL